MPLLDSIEKCPSQSWCSLALLNLQLFLTPAYITYRIACRYSSLGRDRFFILVLKMLNALGRFRVRSPILCPKQVHLSLECVNVGAAVPSKDEWKADAGYKLGDRLSTPAALIPRIEHRHETDDCGEGKAWLDFSRPLEHQPKGFGLSLPLL
jgi:hypothetical protein